MFLDALLDACLDSLKLFPFLFITYLFMEWLEHGQAAKFEKAVAKAGKFGPVVGALLGIIPQCGFSGAAATLYAGRVVTLGTLVSVFLVTSDEMLPVMLSQAVDPALIAKMLAIKLVVGMLVGIVLDAVLRAMKREHVGFGNQAMHRGHSGHDIRQLCEQEGCECADGCACDDCELWAAQGAAEHGRAHEDAGEHKCGHGHEHEHDREHGACCGHDHDHAGEHTHAHAHSHGAASWAHLALAALKHSLQITIFVFVICLVLNLVVEAGLEDAIAAIATTPVVGSVVAAVLGLIPNCAVSVALTQLFLDGVISGGAAMSGLLVNAGVGLIVLFRTNGDSRENLRICMLLAAVGIACGICIELAGLL